MGADTEESARSSLQSRRTYFVHVAVVMALGYVTNAQPRARVCVMIVYATLSYNDGSPFRVTGAVLHAQKM